MGDSGTIEFTNEVARESKRLMALFAQVGILVGASRKTRRFELAAKLAREGNSRRIDQAFLSIWFETQRRAGLTAPEISIADTLEDDCSSVSAALDRVAAEARMRQQRTQAQQNSASKIAACVAWSTHDNPWGWHEDLVEERRRDFDHREPGRLNLFRGWDNLPDGTPIGGCARWDVIGYHGHPTIDWNPHDVAESIRIGRPVREIPPERVDDDFCETLEHFGSGESSKYSLAVKIDDRWFAPHVVERVRVAGRCRVDRIVTMSPQRGAKATTQVRVFPVISGGGA